MLDDTGREPPSIDDMKRDLERAMRVADLFRQQRDNAARLANDLQVELAECRHELERLTGPPGGSSNA
ncbi:MAG TPA: hypothetical protein VEW06_06420 [Xanthobacteraceae bacterium]|nr:hypothetical protein [Xanthobacteraceae bacterium]